MARDSFRRPQFDEEAIAAIGLTGLRAMGMFSNVDHLLCDLTRAVST